MRLLHERKGHHERKLKVVVYARVARRDELTLEQQIKHLVLYANDHNFEVIETISDLGVAGIGNKEAIDRIVNHPALTEGKTLLCHSPNKLSRDTMLFAYAISHLKSKDVSVLFAQAVPTASQLLCLHKAALEAMMKRKK